MRGLATGRKGGKVYEALRQRLTGLPPRQLALLIGQWRSFSLDGYVGLAKDHAQSFAAFMKRQLAGPLHLPGGCLQIPDGCAADPVAEARRYSAAVMAERGIDLQVLGLGRHGHSGCNGLPASGCTPVPCQAATPRTP